MIAAPTRRAFLRALSAASAAAWATAVPDVVNAGPVGDTADGHRDGAANPDPPAATADCCILLWMAGGMAAPETFDPKRYEPFAEGLPVERVLSTFPSIETAQPGVRISAGLENIARVLDRGTLLRSHVQPDLGHILHSRHQYHWHTGYVPPQTVAAPHLGAWVGRLLGPNNPAIPAFVDVGQRLEGVGEKEELKAFHTGGFLGTRHGPFVLPDPDAAAAAVRPPAGMTADRFRRRHELFAKLAARGPVHDSQAESLLHSVDDAHRLLNSPDRAAFDLSLEPEASAARYGDTKFGRGCLLARRLAEAGGRFVEVTTEYVPFLHWDTHENGHATAARMKAEIDAPVAALVEDLESRGLLDRTLVVLASEFSRDMLIEGVPGSDARDQSRAKADVLADPVQYGLHRHFTGGSSVLLFGGGVAPGRVYGATAEERPLVAVENPVTVSDLHATIYAALGISPRAHAVVERRPFYVTEDGNGRAVNALFGA